MRADNNFRYLGKIVKAHGMKGDIVIALEQPDLAIPEYETLFVKSNAGDFIPHKVEEAALKEKSKRYPFFVKFARINSRTESGELVGCEVYTLGEAESLTVNEGESTSLIGYEVFDERGMAVGNVVDEMHTQAHPLIEIEQEGENLILPFVDEYIAGHQPDEKKVIVKNLDRFAE
ncbi:MAG: ribosome maturation factor RimM [Balneolales bacterium]